MRDSRSPGTATAQDGGCGWARGSRGAGTQGGWWLRGHVCVCVSPGRDALVHPPAHLSLQGCAHRCHDVVTGLSLLLCFQGEPGKPGERGAPGPPGAVVSIHRSPVTPRWGFGGELRPGMGLGWDVGRPNWGRGRLRGRGWQQVEVAGLQPRWLPAALDWGQRGGDVAAGSSPRLLPSFEGCRGRIQPHTLLGGVGGCGGVRSPTGASLG